MTGLWILTSKWFFLLDFCFFSRTLAQMLPSYFSFQPTLRNGPHHNQPQDPFLYPGTSPTVWSASSPSTLQGTVFKSRHRKLDNKICTVQSVFRSQCSEFRDGVHPGKLRTKQGNTAKSLKVQFPIGITNGHKHNGLKYHKMIILLFCASKVWYGWAKIKVLARLCFFWKVHGRSWFFVFPAPGCCPHSLTRSPLPSSKPARASWVFLICHSDSDFCLCFHFQGHLWHHWPPRWPRIISLP